MKNRKDESAEATAEILAQMRQSLAVDYYRQGRPWAAVALLAWGDSILADTAKEEAWGKDTEAARWLRGIYADVIAAEARLRSEEEDDADEGLRTNA